MRLILLGAPGAGKGTQGALLAKSHGLDRIVTGDILRKAVRDQTDLGLEARRYMDAGELVPDHLILDMIREVLEGTDRGFVMDGFPRTIEQAERLDDALAAMDLALDAVLVLNAPEDVVVRRISGRRSCPQCGAVYNIYYDPPGQEGVCDSCGAGLVQRADDREETVLNRMRVYRQETQPLIQYYRDSDVPVKVFDGHRTVDEVQDALEDALAGV
jgi:adenylate kinase